ncbi:MAG: hypothetical protein Q8L74_13480 [Nitrospirota bacterium]|nr:hypothetical protein [Nitrospirota bacterium]MDP2383657.1 hypothetical protein [Nitrospirota bacterium]MDP3596829.1 hypothetical protein [Nitrospirota bacterium]
MSAGAGNERCPFANVILSGDARNSRDVYALGNSECRLYPSLRVLSGIEMSLPDAASHGKPKSVNRVLRTIRGSLEGALLLSITLSACGTVPSAPVAAVHRNDALAGESSVGQSLHRQLRERDKRIDELESQLNVLKLIDQGVETRNKPGRCP